MRLVEAAVRTQVSRAKGRCVGGAGLSSAVLLLLALLSNNQLNEISLSLQQPEHSKISMPRPVGRAGDRRSHTLYVEKNAASSKKRNARERNRRMIGARGEGAVARREVLGK